MLDLIDDILDLLMWAEHWRFMIGVGIGIAIGIAAIVLLPETIPPWCLLVPGMLIGAAAGWIWEARNR